MNKFKRKWEKIVKLKIDMNMKMRWVVDAFDSYRFWEVFFGGEFWEFPHWFFFADGGNLNW